MDVKKKKIIDLKGPIVVFGAGGFIGINLLRSLSQYRDDVYGVSQNPETNWRINAGGVDKRHFKRCDITDFSQTRDLMRSIKPKTIFNLSAFGAYSSQRLYKKIYITNFNAMVDLLELAKEHGFDCYVHAGSSSEYGTNSKKPSEDDELLPNSHYALSKVASSYAIKYYGKTEKLPVTNLRIYSAYGPWEEPNRLIPRLISMAKKGEWPSFVARDISRDFVHVDEVCEAFIMAAIAITKTMGNSYNIGSGKKTTIHSLALLAKSVFDIPNPPIFGGMKNRKWDLLEWQANPARAKIDFGWKAKIPLKAGLRLVADWQEKVDYKNAYWNQEQPSE